MILNFYKMKISLSIFYICIYLGVNKYFICNKIHYYNEIIYLFYYEIYVHILELLEQGSLLVAMLCFLELLLL